MASSLLCRGQNPLELVLSFYHWELGFDSGCQAKSSHWPGLLLVLFIIITFLSLAWGSEGHPTGVSSFLPPYEHQG